jgi:uncharacterized protein
MTLLVVSLVALVVGPLLYRVADRARPTLAGLDGFVMVSVAGLAVTHIIPHAFSVAGPLALGVAVLGFIGPSVVEHQLERAAHKAHAATLALAIGGLIVHEFFDGVGLAAPADGDVPVLAIAVVLHRLPLAVTVWWLLAPTSGKRTASAVLVGLGIATVLGYLSGDAVATVVDARWVGLLEALIAGSLLHVVVHRPPPVVVAADGSRERFMAGIGALAGVVVVVLLADEPSGEGPLGFADVFVTLALESAPALVLAFALAGMVQVVLPRASLRWMRTGRPLGEAVRGVAFGLPLPICSCGVIPLYRTLVVEGVPATAAMGFLVATPELGLDAILISLPLLGAELTIARLVAAAVVALVVGVTIGSLAERRRRLPPATASPVRRQVALGARLRAGLHFGFVEIVDHTAPWLLIGLAVAALAGPLLDAAWLTALPWGVDVVLFALLGMPSYVCASGATPLVAVLIHHGVSPGAALAFLLTGPATNVTTFGVLSQLHGRNVALAFGAAIAGLTIGLGVVTNLVIGDATGLALAEAAAEGPSVLESVALAVLALTVALSVLRQGPRAFIGQVLSPYAADGGGHDHDHDHDHDRGHLHADDHDHDHDHRHGR